MEIEVVIPPPMKFSDLCLSRTSTGDVSFDLQAVESIERASGLPHGFFMSQPADTVADLIVSWYIQHRREGGEPDLTAEDLLQETVLEEMHGFRIANQAGRA